MFRRSYTMNTEITSFVTESYDKTCKLLEDGVRTPKHVTVILVLILY